MSGPLLPLKRLAASLLVASCVTAQIRPPSTHHQASFDAEPAITFAACNGNVSEVERLLNANSSSVDARDWLYQTPLHLAAKFNRLEVVKLLIERGANVNARNRDYEETALHLASKGNHLEMMKYLLDNNADVESPISHEIGPGGTPLLYATSYANSIDAVQLLLSRGANINVTNSYPQSALHHAIEHQNIALADFLLRNGINRELKDEWGNTPLNWLVKLFETPQAALVKVLLDHGAAIETRDLSGKSPLHNAAIYGHVEIVALLIEHGAQVDQRENHGRTALQNVIISGIGRVGKMVRLLLRNGANPMALDSKFCDAPLFVLVRNRAKRNASEMIGIAHQLLLFGANSAKVDACTHQNAFALASKLLQFRLLEFLRQADEESLRLSEPDRFSIDSMKSHEIVPQIIHAINRRNLSQVSKLVEDGVYTTAVRDYRHQTPLHFAAKNGYVDVAKYLLEREADVTAEDVDGKTALHNAAAIGHVEMLLLLLSHGADANKMANNGAAPLHYAIDFRNSSDALKILIDHGANVSQPLMPDFMYPLHLAAVNQNFQFMDLLLERGADLEARNIVGATVLNHLVRSNCCYPQLPIVGYLLDKGANIQTVNNDGLSPLHMAIISKKHHQVIEYLLYRGANPNALDARGCNSPLLLLAEFGATDRVLDRLDIARHLLDYGANPSDIDPCIQLTPYDVALEKQLHDVVNLIESRH